MIRVDETDPVGEIEPSFPYRDVVVRRGVEFKDSFEIESEIGRGKFGTVYRCTDKGSGLMLAAKVVNTLKKEDRRSVEREVEIMRRLQHPRLIQLYDAIDTGRQFYVILELIEGGELFERVIDDDFVLTERSCAVFMRQICEGVEFIHGQKILHLDLKPENILCLTKEGNRIKIIDFGLAREYDPKKKLQVLFGTPEFVAPEVVNFDQIGFGTDMWSIGVICYVLLSGLSPFMGDTDIETMANVTIAKYDFDHDAFTDISEDAKDFIRCLLIKEKDKRMTAAQCREHDWLARKQSKQLAELTRAEPRPKAQAHVEIVTSLAELRDNGKEELDLTKDNLRLFVERWREHPDSPYMLDNPQLVVPKCEPEDMNSLRAHSPSPRGSISSILSETTNGSPKEGHSFLLSVPSFSLALERRASEGTGREKSRPDPASQIMLAEEIIKLSEHLRSIALGTHLNTSSEDPKRSPESNVTNNKNTAEKQTLAERSKTSRNGIHSKSNGHVITSESTECNEITEKLSSIARHRKLNGTTFHSSRSFEKGTETNAGNSFASLRKTKFNTSTKSSWKTDSDDGPQEDTGRRDASTSFEQPESSRSMSENASRLRGMEREMDLTPPWRRPRVKHLFGETSRDVPRIVNLRDLHKDLNLDEPTSTKNLLLHLLEEWEDVPGRPSGLGRKSVSVDWCGEESVARKTINSLAEYFQSKQQQSTSSVSQTTSSPIYR